MIVLPVDVRPDRDAAARFAAAAVVDAAVEAVVARGRAHLALSGGRTAEPLLDRLAESELDWSRVDLVQVDERVAPAGDDARNWTHLQSRLLDRLDVRPRVLAMPVDDPDLVEAAAGLARRLPPRFDLVHLGLGTDGHTASLVPGDPALDSGKAVAVTGLYRGHRRMTLTFPALARARRILWLVAGVDKAAMLRRLVEGDRRLPAGRVRRRGAGVVADAAAWPSP